jgi:adenylate cyclase class 2
MPTETEAKFKVASHEPLRELLRAQGATHIGSVTETNRILDRSDNPLKDQGCGLRVRSTINADGSAGSTTLTYKGPLETGPLKSREEWEVAASDVDALVEILLRLGFAPVLTFEKRRESWRVEDCLVELDEPPHIGLFVEIEGPSVDSIKKVQSQLGLAEVAHIPNSYVHLLSQYCESHKSDTRVLLLSDSY